MLCLSFNKTKVVTFLNPKWLELVKEESLQASGHWWPVFAEKDSKLFSDGGGKGLEKIKEHFWPTASDTLRNGHYRGPRYSCVLRQDAQLAGEAQYSSFCPKPAGCLRDWRYAAFDSQIFKSWLWEKTVRFTYAKTLWHTTSTQKSCFVPS